MTRWIDLSDAAKGRIWRDLARKTNFPKEFARLEAEAAAIKRQGLRPTSEARFLKQLRHEWRELQRLQRFAETGINPQPDYTE